MVMESLDFYKILSYGAIGLGCILAFLAYQLLRNEQAMKQPRIQMLTSIYVFMVFSLALSAIGFATEYAKDKEIAQIKEQRAMDEARNREVAESLSVVLEQKEVAALESNAPAEIRRHIEMLKQNVSRLSNSSN
jgi:hypothetical protein